ADALAAEFGRERRQVLGAGLDLDLQRRPAVEPVVTGDGELSRGEDKAIGHRRDPAGRPGVSGARGPKQVPRLTAQVIKIRISWKNGHGISAKAWGSARQGLPGMRSRSLPQWKTKVD